MELVLNLAWIMLAAMMFCLWLRFAPRNGADRRMQLVALAVLLLTLFPVISVTDDLQLGQNLAEADSLLRRGHGCSAANSIFPTIADLPVPPMAIPYSGLLRLATPGSLDAPAIDDSAMAPVQNRPPPVA